MEAELLEIKNFLSQHPPFDELGNAIATVSGGGTMAYGHMGEEVWTHHSGQ